MTHPIPWRERAARRLCELRGWLWDEVIQSTDSDGSASYRRAHEIVTGEIDAELARQQVAEAIAFAREVGDG